MDSVSFNDDQLQYIDLHSFIYTRCYYTLWAANSFYFVLDFITDPSQLANYLLVEYQWQYMVKNYPQMVPPVNPNNAKIKKIFGDQGMDRVDGKQAITNQSL